MASNNVVLNRSVCGSSVQIDCINWNCVKTEGHEGLHDAGRGGTFTDDQSWEKVFEREQAEQRRINSEISSRPGQEMTRS